MIGKIVVLVVVLCTSAVAAARAQPQPQPSVSAGPLPATDGTSCAQLQRLEPWALWNCGYRAW